MTPKRHLPVYILLATLLALPVAPFAAPPVTPYLKLPDIDGESVSRSTEKLELLAHELTHVVQQGGSPRQIAAVADGLQAESRRLENLYQGPRYAEGRRHARAIGAEARRIAQLANELAGGPGPGRTAKIEQRIPARLRHKDRAVTAHKRWLDGLAAGAAARDPDTTGRVKVKLPAPPPEDEPRN